MNSLIDLLQAEAEELDAALDADYQANMFTVEQALRDTGVMKTPDSAYTKSPYDAALMRLINSVPMR